MIHSKFGDFVCKTLTLKLFYIFLLKYCMILLLFLLLTDVQSPLVLQDIAIQSSLELTGKIFGQNFILSLKKWKIPKQTRL